MQGFVSCNLELCVEQAEKLRIIRSHMNGIELCKTNRESLIISVAEKCLPQLILVMTMPDTQSFILLFSTTERWPGFCAFFGIVLWL